MLPPHQLKEGGEVGERNIRLFLQSMKFHLQLHVYSPRDMLTWNWISTKSSPPVSTLNLLNKHQGSSAKWLWLNAWFCIVYVLLLNLVIMLVFLCSHVMGMLHITNVCVLILVYTNTIALCLRGLGKSCRSSVIYHH